jgi:hypothetical protein
MPVVRTRNIDIKKYVCELSCYSFVKHKTVMATFVWVSLKVLSGVVHCCIFEAEPVQKRNTLNSNHYHKRQFGAIIQNFVALILIGYIYHLCQMTALLLCVWISFNMHLFTLLPGLLQRHSGIFFWRSKWVQKFLEEVCRKPWLLSLLSCKTCPKAENPCFESRFFLQVGVNIFVACMLLN